MKSRGIFAIVAALVAGIGSHLKGKQKHSVSSFVPSDSLLGAVNPFAGHPHARGVKRNGGAFGSRARLARYARHLDPRAVRRAITKAQS